jgi:hypothetical protein
MEPIDAQIERLMDCILAMASDRLHTGVEIILDFIGLRPPYRLDIMPSATFGTDDPRRKVFEAQLTYLLNTGGFMFILTPLLLKAMHTGNEGQSITLGTCSVCAVRFQYGRWFPVPADQIDSLFQRPGTDGKGTHWLFRDFPLNQSPAMHR